MESVIKMSTHFLHILAKNALLDHCVWLKQSLEDEEQARQDFGRFMSERSVERKATTSKIALEMGKGN